ncbi:MAG: hypothetical protein LBG17_06365 [Bacteroidales bacterium]|jgi:hypothetical protein|nr:hypothetical protein [Bacteroidales bacterium]
MKVLRFGRANKFALRFPLQQMHLLYTQLNHTFIRFAHEGTSFRQSKQVYSALSATANEK